MEGGGLGLFADGPSHRFDDRGGKRPLYVPHPQPQQTLIGMGIGIGRHGLGETGEKEGGRQLPVSGIDDAHTLISPSNTISAGPSMCRSCRSSTVMNRLPPSSATSTG